MLYKYFDVMYCMMSIVHMDYVYSIQLVVVMKSHITYRFPIEDGPYRVTGISVGLTTFEIFSERFFLCLMCCCCCSCKLLNAYTVFSIK